MVFGVLVMPLLYLIITSVTFVHDISTYIYGKMTGKWDEWEVERIKHQEILKNEQQHQQKMKQLEQQAKEKLEKEKEYELAELIKKNPETARIIDLIDNLPTWKKKQVLNKQSNK